MSVPLDRLYNFLYDICNRNDIIIYRFYPHGSRKVTDCTPLNHVDYDFIRQSTSMSMVCHDQEPLEPKMFSKAQPKFYIPDYPFSVLRSITGWYGLYDKNLLLHSEKNSEALTWFEEDGAIGVYYWSHALIARDWYRYAEIDPKIKTPTTNIEFDFLIYNRAWSGTREYRLQFAELIVEQDLAKNSLMNFNTQCDNLDYRNHLFKNINFQISRNDLENTFLTNTATSDSSADYNIDDYNKCAIEVVLETLFDDTRLHLTEKIFRPIACKKPFILAATAGSLEYLRSYGFKTFGDYIDESYDQIKNSKDRLLAIITLMKQLSALPMDQKEKLYQQLQEICEFNHRRFFSKDFTDTIVNEYKVNLDLGIKQMDQHCNGAYFRRMARIAGSTSNFTPLYTRENLVKLWTWLFGKNSH